jgi:L-alanine-DL-glutamate epimerase-like enolase superfamily enzyme
MHVGGITEAKKIMTLAEPFGVKSAFHGLQTWDQFLKQQQFMCK